MDNVDETESNLDDNNGSLVFDIAVVPKNIIPVDKACNDAHIAQVFPDKYNTMSREVRYTLIEKITNLKTNIFTKARN